MAESEKKRRGCPDKAMNRLDELTFSRRKITQLFAVFRNLAVINNYWNSEVVLGYIRPQYIQRLPACLPHGS